MWASMLKFEEFAKRFGLLLHAGPQISRLVAEGRASEYSRGLC